MKERGLKGVRQVGREKQIDKYIEIERERERERKR